VLDQPRADPGERHLDDPRRWLLVSSIAFTHALDG
jgi:hypothetical protein